MTTSRDLWEKSIEYKYRDGGDPRTAELFQILRELLERIEKLERAPVEPTWRGAGP